MFGLFKSAEEASSQDDPVRDSGREQIRKTLYGWLTRPGGLAFLTRTIDGAPGIGAMDQFARGAAQRRAHFPWLKHC
jgi:hypothetical protein